MVIHTLSYFSTQWTPTVHQIDSFLGATIQETRQSSKTKRILPDEIKSAAAEQPVVINGLDVLSNNQASSFVRDPVTSADCQPIGQPTFIHPYLLPPRSIHLKQFEQAPLV